MLSFFELVNHFPHLILKKHQFQFDLDANRSLRTPRQESSGSLNVAQLASASAPMFQTINNDLPPQVC